MPFETASDPRPRVRLATEPEILSLDTRNLCPAGARRAVILWEDFPDVDGGVPERIARPLALALTTLGEVCFRHEGTGFGDARVVGTVRAHRLPFARTWAIIASRDSNLVLALFGGGWAQGDETGIVAPSSDDRARRLLEATDLTDLTLEGDELVVAAIVDGAGMLIAAREAGQLHDAIAEIFCRCRQVDVEVSCRTP